MSNGLNGVNIDKIAEQTLEALVAKLPVIKMFSTDFSADVAAEGASVTTRVVAQPTAGSLSAGYAASEQAANTTPIQMVLGDVTGLVLGFTDGEWSKSSVNLQEIFIKPAVNAVAAKVIGDALALVTASNYGVAVYDTVAEGTLDSDAVADIAGDMSDANVPDDGRFLMVKPALFTSLCKDDVVKYSVNFGGTEAVRMRQIPALSGFAPVVEYTGIPANGESLVGIAGHKSAICIATRVPATPEGFVGECKDVTDEATGLTIQIRKWYSQDAGKHYLSMGILYGVAKGNVAGLKRLTAVPAPENSSSSSSESSQTT